MAVPYCPATAVHAEPEGDKLALYLIVLIFEPSLRFFRPKKLEQPVRGVVHAALQGLLGNKNQVPQPFPLLGRRRIDEMHIVEIVQDALESLDLARGVLEGAEVLDEAGHELRELHGGRNAAKDLESRRHAFGFSAGFAIFRILPRPWRAALCRVRYPGGWLVFRMAERNR